MSALIGMLLGLLVWFVLRVLVMGVYTVDQNERAVKTSFGRAERVPGDKTTLDDPIAEALRRRDAALHLSAGARDSAGRPLFQDAVGEDPQGFHRHHDHQHGARSGKSAPPTTAARVLEAVTKDQLNTGLTGQIRYRVSEAQSVRVPVRHQEAVRARDGIFRFGAAAEGSRISKPSPTAGAAAAGRRDARPAR